MTPTQTAQCACLCVKEENMTSHFNAKQHKLSVDPRARVQGQTSEFNRVQEIFFLFSPTFLLLSRLKLLLTNLSFIPTLLLYFAVSCPSSLLHFQSLSLQCWSDVSFHSQDEKHILIWGNSRILNHIAICSVQDCATFRMQNCSFNYNN